MSEKAKKKAKVAPKKDQKPARLEIKRPSGRVPTANVSSRKGTLIVLRGGKGFSRGELIGAELPFDLAGKWGVPRDVRRRSVLEPNVGSLKKWFSPPRREPEAPHPERTPGEKPVKKRAARKKKTAA